MRIAQAVRPDFWPGALQLDERVVVRNPVSAVFADEARVRLFVQVGNDTDDLSHEGVQPLRIWPDLDDARFARCAVADLAVQHAPIGIAGASRGVERQIAHGVTPGVQPDTHQFTAGAVEYVVW